MLKKTYYMILGVARTETPRGIRAAYRDLAKKLHPDVAGEKATRAFQELTEAYDVLADPKRRRAYNDRLRQSEERDATARQPIAIVGHPESISPCFEALHERLLRNFTGISVPKSERLESLSFEVVLTPEEAAEGCSVPIGVPIFHACSQCGGSGRDWLYPCVQCEERGMIESEQIVRIRIPAMIPSGSVFEIPLEGLGIHNFYLRLAVVVQPPQRWWQR